MNSDNISTSDYLVDGILQHGLVNIIYGPSGSNKTTWVLQLLKSLALNEPFLGEFMPTGPLPVTHYLALDRPPKEFDKKLLKYFPELQGRMTFQSLFPELEEIDKVEKIFKYVPQNTQLLVIDGIGFVLEGNSLISQRGVGKLMSKCYGWCVKNNSTMLLVHHTAKNKQGSGYTNARESAAGSGAWAQTAAVSVLIKGMSDDIEDPKRDVCIMQNNAAGRNIKLEMTASGLMQIATGKIEQLDRSYSRAEIREAWPNVDESTVTRRIQRLVESDKLKHTGYDSYWGKIW